MRNCKLLCVVMIACGDDAATPEDAGDPCLGACAGDAGPACGLRAVGYDEALRAITQLCAQPNANAFSTSCANGVRGLVLGFGSGNTTLFYAPDGGYLGVRTDSEAIDPSCDGHTYAPQRLSCNGTIASDLCSQAPVGSAFQ
jgi:hypothetical protein